MTTTSIWTDLELVNAWLRPAGYVGAVRDRVEAVRSSALTLASDLAGGSTDSSLTYVAQKVLTDPELLRRLPGHAGLPMGADPTFSNSVHVQSGLDILATELAALAGDDREVGLPPRAQLLLPLSGLAVDLPADGALRLTAGAGGLRVSTSEQQVTLPVADDGRSLVAQPGTTAQPRVHADQVTVEQHWDLLAAPVAEFLEPTEIIPASLTEEDRLTIYRAIRLLHLAAPAIHDELVRMPVSVIPLAPRPGVIRQSASLRQIPGVVYTNLCDPFEVVDLIVHEHSHLKLAALEADGPLMARPAAETLAPWRKDRRTAQGLFHGIYVFHQVAQVFDAIFARWAPSERGQTRSALLRICVERGLRLLDEADPALTPLGAGMAAHIGQDNAAGLERLRHSSAGAVAWADKVVTEHLQQAGHPDSEGPWFLAE